MKDEQFNHFVFFSLISCGRVSGRSNLASIFTEAFQCEDLMLFWH